jgi:hypothetical protein
MNPNARKHTLFLLIGVWMSLSTTAFSQGLSEIWANDGGEKIPQEDMRATPDRTKVYNTVWDGNRITVFGGRNEVVSFNVILEAGHGTASNVAVTFKQLSSGAGQITSFSAKGDGVFNWTQRPIELFYVRYLQIRGLSKVSYGTYDERHIPTRFRRPWSGNGAGSGTWYDRPDHDKHYPEIAVPLELVPTFTIAGGQSQSIWVDIYIPKTTTPGAYDGNLIVQENGTEVKTIPVQLRVCNIMLPDTPSAKTMLFYSYLDIDKRYGSNGSRSQLIRDRHFQLAHRHRISLIGDNTTECGNPVNKPCPEWIPRLDGSLFTPSRGYDGPGSNTGNGIYSIGTYGGWDWQSGGQSAMWQHTDAWATWFGQNFPQTDYFLYLIDESPDTAQIESWASWILKNPGPGRQVRSMATIDLPTAASRCPSLDIPTSTLATGVPQNWQGAADRYTSDPRKQFWVYNGHRPATGSFATEDDGVALRQLAWAQFKKHIQRWFFWAATYYNDYQGGRGETNVFQTAETFGGAPTSDSIVGETGWNYSNGDGVLMYPGTEVMFPSDSYGVNGPFASIRMKEWRRGIQDVDYLTMAAAMDPAAVRSLVNTMVPKALWDFGVDNPSDPSYVHADLGWPNNPETWERARAQMALLIGGSDPLAATFHVASDMGFSRLRVFPNPWRKDQHAGSPVTFENVPPGTTVKIFTVAAHLAKRLPPTTGTAVTWDLTNESGSNVASGLYVYLLESPSGDTTRGKLAVIR